MPALTPEQEMLKQAALALSAGDSLSNNDYSCAQDQYENLATPTAILAILAQLESYIAEYEKVADRLAQLEAAQAVPDGWIDLIEWLLGKKGPFPTRNSANEGLYWWRKELRARYEKLIGAAPGEPGQ